MQLKDILLFSARLVCAVIVSAAAVSTAFSLANRVWAYWEAFFTGSAAMIALIGAPLYLVVRVNTKVTLIKAILAGIAGTCVMLMLTLSPQSLLHTGVMYFSAFGVLTSVTFYLVMHGFRWAEKPRENLLKP